VLVAVIVQGLTEWSRLGLLEGMVNGRLLDHALKAIQQEQREQNLEQAQNKISETLKASYLQNPKYIKNNYRTQSPYIKNN
jgi:membrane protease subunit (stomatin/prohibitin family)